MFAVIIFYFIVCICIIMSFIWSIMNFLSLHYGAEPNIIWAIIKIILPIWIGFHLLFSLIDTIKIHQKVTKDLSKFKEAIKELDTEEFRKLPEWQAKKILEAKIKEKFVDEIKDVNTDNMDEPKD